jgi:hypothetical protein
MLQALVAEVKKLSGKTHAPSFPADLVAFTRKKVEPMVRGLFRRDEQEPKIMGEPRSACRVIWPGSILWRPQFSSTDTWATEAHSQLERVQPTTWRLKMSIITYR